MSVKLGLLAVYPDAILNTGVRPNVSLKIRRYYKCCGIDVPYLPVIFCPGAFPFPGIPV